MYQQWIACIRLAAGSRGGTVRKQAAFCITRYMLVGAVANRTPAGLLAHAEKNLPRFLGLVLNGFNFCRSVAAVTKRLSLAAPARAPKIILPRFNVDAFRAAPGAHDLVRVFDVWMRRHASTASSSAGGALVLRRSALTSPKRENGEFSCHVGIIPALCLQPVARALHAGRSLLSEDSEESPRTERSGCSARISDQLSTFSQNRNSRHRTLIPDSLRDCDQVMICRGV